MSDERVTESRLALIGAVIAAVISVLCILAPAAILTYEWIAAEGQTTRVGPPLSVYVFTAAIYFVPALSVLGLLLAWFARRGLAWSRLLRLAFLVHATALLLAAAAWLWTLASQS